MKHISVHLSLIHKIQNQSGYIDKLNLVVHLRTRDHRQQSQFCVRWNCREKSQGFRWFCSHVNHVFQPNNCTFVVELATILSHHAKRDWLIRFPWIVEFFLFVSQTSRTLCKEQKGSPHLLDVQWLCRCGAFFKEVISYRKNVLAFRYCNYAKPLYIFLLIWKPFWGRGC